MRSKVICFASAKGGSGKTVISASLAKFLAGLGKKVLLVDMDAATNGLSLFYLGELVKARKLHPEEARGIFEATEGKLPTPFNIDDAVDMIPSVYVMKQTEDISPDGFRKSISETLSAFRDKYNYIILDAQAGTDIYAQIAMESADETAIVSEYDPVSAEGVERLKHLLPKALPPNRTWILFNKILPEFAQSLGDFLSVARYLSPLPWDAEVMRAFARRRLAIDMESGNDYTLAIIKTASSLLGEEIEEQINRWKQDKEEFLRAPARSQLEAIEEEISLMEQAQIQTEYNLKSVRERLDNFYIVSVTVFVAAIAGSTLAMVSETQFSLSTILGVDIGVAAVGSAVIFFLRRKIRQWTRREETQSEGQVRALARRLEDLKERRKKYRTLAESSLETLFKKA